MVSNTCKCGRPCRNEVCIKCKANAKYSDLAGYHNGCDDATSHPKLKGDNKRMRDQLLACLSAMVKHEMPT